MGRLIELDLCVELMQLHCELIELLEVLLGELKHLAGQTLLDQPLYHVVLDLLRLQFLLALLNELVFQGHLLLQSLILLLKVIDLCLVKLL